ncbi:hypothetical protein H5410_028214 [Solanum commersonii]|uniref:Uncharacterized protein n=1 Tax=Solanum commersonii TaxID=4109 RepID=A0A9J5Z216_SOLCO|nr:hypothetical protein H5410_028214 [Solanum commersonii]
MEKMLGKVTSWTSRFQSYVGRTELLKSVLSTIQTFWAQKGSHSQGETMLPSAVNYRGTYVERKRSDGCNGSMLTIKRGAQNLEYCPKECILGDTEDFKNLKVT